MSSSSGSSNSGLSLGGVVFVVLLIMKLFKVIEISWWWVFSPILIGLSLDILILIIAWIIIKRS